LISKILVNIEKILIKEKPDAFVIYGDTNSCLSAYVAKRLKIPIFHFEAGNRCFDENVPEEINRRIIDHISDVNFVLSDHARSYLVTEGIKQNYIIKTGSHLKEVIKFNEEKIEKSNILSKLKIKKEDYFVASIHREENVEDKENFLKILNTINILSNKYRKKIIFSLHPRSKKKIQELKFKLSKKIILSKPFSFFDYLSLQKNSLCVLSDSGTLTEEAYLLNFRALSVRSSNERPEGIDKGVIIFSNNSPKNIINAVTKLIRLEKEPTKKLLLPDYEISDVSKIAVNTIFSYVDIVNRIIWKKKN
jgi:UDP-N-acetylglucosamine 2-epimerase (non-hydrolysing)